MNLSDQIAEGHSAERLIAIVNDQNTTCTRANGQFCIVNVDDCNPSSRGGFSMTQSLFSSIQALRFLRRLASAALSVSALSLFAAPAAAQVQGDFIGGSSRICLGDDAQLTITLANDCPAPPFQDRNLHGLRFGPDAAPTTLTDDGSATFGGSAIFNGGVQFNGQVNLAGYTTVNQLNSGSIVNSGTISTNNLNTSALHVTGNGSFSGALSSDTFYANSATIAALHVPGAATFDTTVTVGGSLTAHSITATNGLVVASGATIDAGGNRIQNVGAPTAGTDAANRDYVDSTVQSVQSGVAALGTQVANHETRIAAVETVNTQQETHLTAIDTRNATQDVHLTAIDIRDAAQDSHLSSIDTVNVGQDARMTAIESVNSQQSQQISTLQDQVGGLRTDVAGLHQDIRRANGGIAAAVALGGTMIVPDSKLSFSFNLATYRSEQAYSGSIVGRVSNKVYVQAGFGGSTVRGSSAGRIGLTFGL
ncbi:putative coiled-coil protein SlyX [Sphingomonas sp. UYAg733]